MIEMTPLPDDVAAALVEERERPGVDAATRARVRVRLQSRLAAGDASGAGVKPDASPRHSSGLLRRLGLVHPALTGAVGLVIGVTAGMALHARLDAGRARTVDGAPPIVMRPAPVPSATARSEVPPPAPRVDTPVSRDVHSTESAASPAPSGSTLTAERALLDVAHTALANGRAADALDALGRHAQRFPRGVYREEREALTIQSLRALGRTDEAERRATAFRTRYPRSLFLSTVEGSHSPNP